MQVQNETQQAKRVPIRADLFTKPLDDLSKVSLAGSKCHNCGEVFMGKVYNCANCGGDDIEDIVFGKEGKLWTYTLIQYQPPGEYKGPTDPFVPFIEGLVELPEGIRIVAPVLELKTEDVRIDMPLELVIYDFFTDEDGNKVVAFYYRPKQGAN